jgi:hypothetical protein
MAARIRLGELLVRAGVLDEFKLKAALAEQARWGGRLGRILVEMNFVTEDLLVKALSKQLGIPRARFESANIPQDIVAKIDGTFCSNNAICPERYITDKKTLIVAMADPTNVSAIDELRFKTGLKVECSLAGELEITQAIDRILYGREPIDGIELSSIRENPVRQPSPEAVSRSLMEANRPNPMSTTPSSPPDGRPMNSGNHVSQPVLTDPRMSLPPFDPRLGATVDLRSVGQGHPTIPPSARPQGTAMEMALTLDAAQKKQLKAIRVMLELLIEKGVFSRDEYIQLVNKR